MNENLFINNRKMTSDADSNQPVDNVEAWKQVTLGGVAGIFMGAGLMYTSGLSAKDAKSDEAENSTTIDEPSIVSVRVSEVDSDISFGEAFASARAEVGPGGVFYWHGGIYNTYTAEEWNSMSISEKNEFAQLVRPEIKPHYVNTPTDEYPDVVIHNADDDVIITDNSSVDDGDVHIVGYANVHGHLAVGLDTTGDGDADIAIIDVDDNRHMSDADVVVDDHGNFATIGEIVNGSDPCADIYTDPTNNQDADNIDSDIPLFEC